MLKYKLWLVALFAVPLLGCESGSGTATTGAPIEVNKDKNALGSYGDPNSGAKTTPGPKK